MTPEVVSTPLAGVLHLRPKLWQDSRGHFFELWNRRDLEEIGISGEWVQDNASMSCAGTLRGMHYQLRRPQAKLVTCLAGEIIDVALDVRRGSPSFGVSVAVRLKGDEPSSLYVPEGFAHGFLVVSKNAIVTYKVTDFYSPADERGIAWNDPAVEAQWQAGMGAPVLSPRDAAWPALKDAWDLPDYSPTPASA